MRTGASAGPALEVEGSGTIDPVGARLGLARLVREAGGQVMCGHRVAAVEQDGDDLVVRAVGLHLRAELVVHAAGVGALQVERWLRGAIWPVRSPVLRLSSSPERFLQPWVSQSGYVSGRSLPGGDVLLSGCRWAALEQGMGGVDEVGLDPQMERALRAFARRFSGLADAAEAGRWSEVTAHTCDGLPLVGPIPGRTRELLCLGFQGFDASLALVAARAVADGVVSGRAADWPGWLTPGRLAR